VIAKWESECLGADAGIEARTVRIEQRKCLVDTNQE
jgi:hypothetical protein